MVYCETFGHMGDRIEKEGGETNVLCASLAFRGATGSRPSGWGGRKPCDIPPVNHNLCNVSVFTVHFPYDFPGILPHSNPYHS